MTLAHLHRLKLWQIYVYKYNFDNPLSTLVKIGIRTLNLNGLAFTPTFNLSLTKTSNTLICIVISVTQISNFSVVIYMIT